MQIVVVVVSKVHDSALAKFVNNSLLTYVRKMFTLREMIKLRKEWDDKC